MHKRHFLIRGLILGLSIGLLVYCGRINNHDSNSTDAESSSGDYGSEGTDSSDKTTVQITVSLMEQSASGVPTSTTLGFQVVAFDVTVAGCMSDQNQYNKVYSDIAFTYPSTTSQFTLPGDDPACFLSLSKLTVKNMAGRADQRSVYQHSNTDDLESAKDRDSGGVMIFGRTSGSIGPGKITFQVTKTNWLNETTPSAGARISYIFRIVSNS